MIHLIRNEAGARSAELENGGAGAVRQREPQERRVERHLAGLLVGERALVETGTEIAAGEFAAADRGAIVLAGAQLQPGALERHQRARAHALEARDLDRADAGERVHMRRQSRHHQVADGGRGREIGDVLDGDFRPGDRVLERHRRHAAVAVGRRAVLVERVVAGLDPVLPQHQRLELARRAADAADMILDLTVADRLARQETAQSLDEDVAHAAKHIAELRRFV